MGWTFRVRSDLRNEQTRAAHVCRGPAVSGPSGARGDTPEARSARSSEARDARNAMTGPAPSGDVGGDGGVVTEPAPPSETSATKAVVAVAAGVREAGAPVLGFLNAVGDHVLLIGRSLAWLPRRPFRWANYLDAAEFIGFGSLPIVLLVGAFTGLVTSLQSVVAFSQFGLESFSGGATGKALSIELGPVLTSLMLSGRVGAGIATELGTMRITEQIDALESMAVSPVQYLVLPRLIAAMVVTPILALVFFVVGMGAAWFYAVIV